MPTVIDELVIELGLDASKMTGAQRQAMQQLRQFEAEALSTGKRIESTGQVIQNIFSEMKRNALSAVGIFLGGMGIKEFTGFVTNLDAATARVARTMDLSTRELSAWQGVAQQAGGSAQGITATLQGLSSELNKFKLTGQTSLTGPLTQLGVSMFGANNQLKTSAQLFLDIADAIKKVADVDPAQARAIGQMLGMDQDSINLAIQGRRILEENLELNKRIGGTTDESAAAAQEYQQELGRLERSAQGVGRSLLTAMMPSLINVLGRLRELIGVSQQLSYEWEHGLGQEATQHAARSFSDLFFSSLKASTGIDFPAFTDWVNQKTGGALGRALGSPTAQQTNLASGLRSLKEQFSLPPNLRTATSAGGSDDAAMAVYAQAIANIESSGGNYGLTGPVIPTGPHAGSRAYGKYQVMDFNIGQWTQDAIGRRMTPEEFLRDPAAQEAVFRKKFGELVAQYGPAGAARRWLGTGKRDLATGMTGDDYVARFTADVARHVPQNQVGAGAAASASSVNNVSNRGGDSQTNSVTIEQQNINVRNASEAAQVATDVNKTTKRQNALSTVNTGQQ